MNLGFIDCLHGQDSTRPAVLALANAAVMPLAQDRGEDVVIGGNVTQNTRDGTQLPLQLMKPIGGSTDDATNIGGIAP